MRLSEKWCRTSTSRVAAISAFALCLFLLLTAGAGASNLIGRVAARLVYSRASNEAVQGQPAPGACHAIGSGQYSRPDPRCTPGALNPAVTQGDINLTICKSGWTQTVRPSERITEQEKRLSLAAYGDRQPLGDYEYDHFVPLELGGATNDPRNLWPEPGASPNPKDAVEDYLNREVCEHKMTLAHAQAAIAANWIAIYRQLGNVSQPKPPTTPAGPSATCSANAQWSSEYGDYDVYLSSNQPDTKVTVSGAGASALVYRQLGRRRCVLARQPPGGWRDGDHRRGRGDLPRHPLARSSTSPARAQPGRCEASATGRASGNLARRADSAGPPAAGPGCRPHH